MNQVLGVRRFSGTLHLLVDPEMRAEFEAGLHYQFFVSQILIDAELQVEVALDLACPDQEALQAEGVAGAIVQLNQTLLQEVRRLDQRELKPFTYRLAVKSVLVQPA